MPQNPLERAFGTYRITLRKTDHVDGRPTPHVEIWKGNRKLGNYDMATGRALFSPKAATPHRIQRAIEGYLRDRQVQRKVREMIEESYFDLSKPAGQYGGVPRGVKVTISVEYTEESLRIGGRG